MPMNKGSKIPKKEVVQFILKDILKGKKEIFTQKQLAEIIKQNLKKVEPNYTISEKRARSVILEMPDIKILVETRKGKMPEKCPSCSHSLKKIYTKNLKGRKIVIGLKCTKCGYTGKEGNWIPKRYIFKL
jgi:predicted RNA-binding Zn-ribbon protein involved in translation (DUF1610 family)